MISWKQRVALAERMDISVSFVHDILFRRRSCPVKRAYAMAKAYYDLFGVYVPFWEFTFNKTSLNPIFRKATYEDRLRIEGIINGTADLGPKQGPKPKAKSDAKSDAEPEAESI